MKLFLEFPVDIEMGINENTEFMDKYCTLR